MSTAKVKKEINLADAKISTLIAKFALPAILANIVSSVYNIADQMFIGNSLGTNGTGAMGSPSLSSSSWPPCI